MAASEEISPGFNPKSAVNIHKEKSRLSAIEGSIKSSGLYSSDIEWDDTSSIDTIFFQPMKNLGVEKETQSRLTLKLNNSNLNSKEKFDYRPSSNPFLHPNNLTPNLEEYKFGNCQYGKPQIKDSEASYKSSPDDMQPNSLVSIPQQSHGKNSDLPSLVSSNSQYPIQHIYSTDGEDNLNSDALGTQDQYIPGLDFSNLVDKWQSSSSESLSKQKLIGPTQSNEILNNNGICNETSPEMARNYKFYHDFDDNDHWFKTMVQNNNQGYTVSLDNLESTDTNISESITQGSIASNNEIHSISILNSPNDSFIYSPNNHSKVAPIPLPNVCRKQSIEFPIPLQRRITSPMEQLDRSQGLSSLYSGEGATTLDGQQQFSTSFNSILKRKTSLPSSLYSASSSLTFLPNYSNTKSMFEDLKMNAEQVVNLIKKLPKNFIDLPYSQRKKIIMEQVPNKNYKLLLSLIKKHLLSTSKSNISLTKNSLRSRHDSIASQYLNSFSPSSPPMLSLRSGTKPDDKGSSILGHNLGKIIGFGAWGMVRECYDNQSGYPRAIKIVRFKNNQVIRKKVIKEVNIWKGLDHKNILPLLDWKLDREYAMYCLTEKVEDGTLYDLVIMWDEFQRLKISFQERCRTTIKLMLQLISALSYMHSKNIVHGDVKLENCLLAKSPNIDDWKVFLCDFGMSVNVTSNDSCALESDDDESAEVDNDTGIEMKVMPSNPYPTLRMKKQAKDAVPERRPSLKMATSPKRNIVSNPSCIRRLLDHNQNSKGVIMNRKSVGNEDSIQHSFSKKLNDSRKGRVKRLSSQKLTKSPIAITSLSISAFSTHLDRTLPNSVGNPGVSKDHSFSTANPISESNIGSLPYASPELLLGVNSANIFSDIWALGVTIYTMLLGRLPFKQEYESKLRASILSGKYDKLSLRTVCNITIKQSPSVDEKVEKFDNLFNAVTRCLVSTPEKRWTLEMIKIAFEKDLS